MLEKWYVWDGDIEKGLSFTKYVTGIVFADGMIIEVSVEDSYRNSFLNSCLWENLGTAAAIVAYTKGEQVESKSNKL